MGKSIKEQLQEARKEFEGRLKRWRVRMYNKRPYVKKLMPIPTPESANGDPMDRRDPENDHYFALLKAWQKR